MALADARSHERISHRGSIRKAQLDHILPIG